MANKASIGEMSVRIMKELEKYADLAADDLKDAVREKAKTIRKDIQANAPSDTRKYKNPGLSKICMKTPGPSGLWFIQETGVRLRTV